MSANRIRHFGAVGLVVTVGLAASSGAASAPATGSRQATDSAQARSKIAFTRGSNSPTSRPSLRPPDGIYVMNADGSGKRFLTRYASLYAWSPDGRKIAFVSRRERCQSAPSTGSPYICGNAEIYVMNADGTGQRNLTRSPANAYYSSAAWSPDGRKMAFVSDRDGNAEIYVMNANGSAQRRLTRNPASDGGPVWSPDGRKIVFVSGAGELESSGVYVMNADGSGQVNLTP
jgi:Tol biopolymer transport system component